MGTWIKFDKKCKFSFIWAATDVYKSNQITVTIHKAQRFYETLASNSEAVRFSKTNDALWCVKILRIELLLFSNYLSPLIFKKFKNLLRYLLLSTVFLSFSCILNRIQNWSKYTVNWLINISMILCLRFQLFPFHPKFRQNERKTVGKQQVFKFF